MAAEDSPAMPPAEPVLVMSGGLKFLAFAAEGIEPLVSNGPLLAWLDPLLGPRLP